MSSMNSGSTTTMGSPMNSSSSTTTMGSAMNSSNSNSTTTKMMGGRRRGRGTRRAGKGRRGTRKQRGGQATAPATAPAAPSVHSTLSVPAAAPSAPGKPMMGGKRGKMVGTKAQVWHGTAHHTVGGLTKKDLMKHKGRIVSKKKHALGKKAFKKLVAAGYKPKKGTFKLFRK